MSFTLEPLAQDFTTRLETIVDPKVRSRAAANRIQRLSPEVAAHLLYAIWEGACHNHRPSQQVLMDFAANVPLSEALSYEFTVELYRACVDEGIADIARLLLSPQSLIPDEIPEENAHMPDMELGRRKAMARQADRDTLDRLVRDPQESVIGILLNNPKVLERDVVHIAANRPTSPEALMHVFRHTRWLPRYAVKHALAANPYLPSDAALALLPFLQGPDLTGIANDERISMNVRVVARRLSDLRRASRRRGEED